LKRPKLVISVIVLVVIIAAAVCVNFLVYDFYSPSIDWAKKALAKIGGKPSSLEEGAEIPAGLADANQPKRAGDVNTPADANKPEKIADSNEAGKVSDANEAKAVGDVNEPNEPIDPNKIMEAVNLKDVEMKDIIAKIAEWTGKNIIPDDEAMKQKITIYAPAKMPRPEALSLIYAALRTKGYIAEEVDNVLYLKPIKEALFGSVPMVPPDKPLAAIENKNQIVEKHFKLRNYSPTNMSNVILPLVGEYGYVSADEDSGSLLVIDTVANLIRFERIIMQFDVPEAEQTVTEVFQIQESDPAEIVQILKLLLGIDERTGRRTGRSGSQTRPAPAQGSPATGGTKPAASVVIAPAESEIILIPEPRRKWIIVKASADDMKRIAEWIEKLDRKEQVGSEYETVPVTYVDAYEVGDRINRALQRLPGSELRSSVLVQPLSQARQIMIFGNKEMRDMVKKLIKDIDIPPGELIEKTFILEYADPEQIKKNLDELYGEDVPIYDTYYYYRYGPGSQRTAADVVRVIAFPAMQQVTVIASPENMEKITEQIKQWDVPIDVEAVKPRIIELHNTDPVQMAQLLSELFSEEQAGGLDFLRLYFYPYRSQEEKKKIVGPLYGQLTFRAVPETKKIIIISKIPEAYKVVEELIRELDREEMAEVPEVITLKYADPEDLAVRLNAIFNEPGVPAVIWFSETGLSEYSMEEESQPSQGQRDSQQQQQGSTRGQYTPPWSSQRSRAEEDRMPISNVIGRIRFIPDPHSKSLLVLSPPEFKDRIIEMIGKLDQPGRQVMIKAIIMEVDHSDLTSLGLQLSSNPADAFGTLEENAIEAVTKLSFLDTYGSLTLEATADITSLIDFLVKKVDARILNQQTLWTKDNEEAEFFKGDNVAFQTSASTSETGGRVTSSFDFKRVGMSLRARPSITPEKNVDMIVNVILSQLTGEIVNGQPVRSEMETQTNMIVQDGQTIMLGGILFQTDTQIERKLPVLGDVPAVGGLFRHNETTLRNNELIVFITPYVIDSETGPEAQEELEKAREKLNEMREQLSETAGKEK